MAGPAFATWPAWARMKALVIKELLAMLRDKKGRITLVAPPILQLVLFSFASTLAIEHADIVYLDRDGGTATAEIIQQIQGSPNFRSVTRVASEKAMENAIDEQNAVAGIYFPQGFTADLKAGHPAPIQIVYDGRRSNASQIVNAYLGQILASANISINSAGQRNQGTPPSEIVPSNAFNPNLEYMWFVLPSLIAMISAITTLSVTAQSVARERELGTFDQLMVTPLRVHEILIGKSIPPFLVGLLNSTIFIVAAVFVFEVPLRGSLVLLYGAIIFYLLSVIGVGLFISSLSKTQQQAFLGTFIFITPAVLLSGYASPIDNIPFWLERISLANPVRHFIVIVQGVFLKAMPLMEVLANTVPLIIISIFTLSAAAWLFRHRME
ncbi:ABC transporter permease [uncultured Parasphingorhabdus sp.]|uniref:ABC transporter permease n=1 Tax=uncultured Parasphingorhabdus sp. TaxID=2709694 RepID=UPI0030DB6952|tara:strand:- start:6997 stop:8142 length:1146 start_codon:yes stop_codon:yes gene_type:complete